MTNNNKNKRQQTAGFCRQPHANFRADKAFQNIKRHNQRRQRFAHRPGGVGGAGATAANGTDILTGHHFGDNISKRN